MTIFPAFRPRLMFHQFNKLIRPVRLIAASLLLMIAGCNETNQPPEATETTKTQAFPVTEEQTVGADWSNFRGNRSLTGIAPGILPDEPELLWTFEAEGAIVSSPVIADSRVYFGSDDGNIYCLDFRSGKLIWSYSTDYMIEAPPLVHDGIVYVGSNDFFFYALDALSGELKWKFETYEKIVGSANVVRSPDGNRDWIIIGSHDAFIYAVDAKTGEKIWEFETNDRVNGSPAVIDDKIVFGGCDTILYVLDAATGQPTSRIELGGDSHIAASVGIDGHEVFFGHHGNEFVSIDLETEAILWRYPSPRFGFFSPPAITPDRVIFGGRDKQLHCVDRDTGLALWTFPTRRKIDSAPVVCDDKVIFGSGDGRLYVVRLEDGEEVWSYDIGQSIFSSPAVVDGIIIVGANDGRLYAFGKAKDKTD